MDVRPEERRRRSVARPALLVIAGVLVLTAAATAVWTSRSSDDARRVAASIPFDTTVPPSVAVLPPVPPSSARPTAAPATSTTATTPAITVSTLQTVPPVRDLIVEIGGDRYSTDGSGAISVGGIDPAAEVVVIGVLANPPIQQVDFLGWADGGGAGPRALRSLAGPVASLGLSLSSRVVVGLVADTVDTATVRFESEDGPVLVPLDTPTWLPDRRAVPGETGLTVQQHHYIARRLITPDGAAPLAPQQFVATPEARWVIGISS